MTGDNLVHDARPFHPYKPGIHIYVYTLKMPRLDWVRYVFNEFTVNESHISMVLCHLQASHFLHMILSLDTLWIYVSAVTVINV